MEHVPRTAIKDRYLVERIDKPLASFPLLRVEGKARNEVTQNTERRGLGQVWAPS